MTILDTVVLDMVVTRAPEYCPPLPGTREGMNLMVARLLQMPGSRVHQHSVHSATRLDITLAVASSPQRRGLANGAAR